MGERRGRGGKGLGGWGGVVSVFLRERERNIWLRGEVGGRVGEEEHERERESEMGRIRGGGE